MSSDLLIHEDKFSEHQAALYEAMSEISEECWCAGWMLGLETALWEALSDSDRRYGRSEIAIEDLEDVRRLSTLAKGWIIWRDDDSEFYPEPDIEKWGPYFVPMDDWLRLIQRSEP